MSETANPSTTDVEPKTIQNKEYRWSYYSFFIDMINYTLLTSLVVLLMLLHKAVDSLEYKGWIITIVGISLEIIFAGLAVIDSRRKNPKEKMYGSQIFSIGVFAITIMITIAIFWNSENIYAIAYGGICGGFAGYLAGALAYPNFIVKIKDKIYRTILGGAIGVSLGAIAGSIIAWVVEVFVNGFPGGVFGGIFMGFWGGALVSGPIATIILFIFKGKERFTVFFTKMLVWGTVEEVSKDLQNYFTSLDVESEKKLEFNQCLVLLQEEDHPINLKDERDETAIKKILRGIRFIVYFVNPWVEGLEEDRVESFKQIFLFASNKLGYTLENEIITVK
ncbi:MAG: hypothetical protein ACTSSH_03390 [Candidatus Heimdallarchaeota archaeon]